MHVLALFPRLADQFLPECDLSVSLILCLYLFSFPPFPPNPHRFSQSAAQAFFSPCENIGHRSDSRKAARSRSSAALLFFPAFCSLAAAEDSTHVLYECACVCVLLPYSDSECHSRGTNHSIQQPVLHRFRLEQIFFSFAETKPPARPIAYYQRWFETLWETVCFFIHILWFVITLICQGYVNQCTMHCMLNLGQNVDITPWLKGAASKDSFHTYPLSKQTRNHKLCLD